MTMKILKWGNSQGIRFSKELLERAGLSVDDPVDIRLNENDEIVISKSKKEKLTFEMLMKDWDGTYPEIGDTDWGDPVGEEIW
ncbi:MAG: PbsX family transcriptional regulator [Erysipelotrichaceae bacterium]|nr:PbsX family transcriptional regulator [Erysipelotrichaceae bacterium]